MAEEQKFTLQEARALLDREAPPIVVPVHAAPKTPEEAAKGHSTTTMVFDKPVHLTISTNDSVFYPVGVHEVPNHLVKHWYLKAHGARIYAKPISFSEQIADGVPSHSGKGKRGK